MHLILVDRWLDDVPVAAIAPNIVKVVPELIKSKCMVADAISTGRWIHDFKP